MQAWAASKPGQQASPQLLLPLCCLPPLLLLLLPLQAHPKGAISVPAFIVIDSFGTAGEFAKWLACKANGVTPTKPNPALAAEIAAAAGSGKAVRGSWEGHGGR